jgi:hypothetical protein
MTYEVYYQSTTNSIKFQFVNSGTLVKGKPGGAKVSTRPAALP